MFRVFSIRPDLKYIVWLLESENCIYFRMDGLHQHVYYIITLAQKVYKYKRRNLLCASWTVFDVRFRRSAFLSMLYANENNPDNSIAHLFLFSAEPATIFLCFLIIVRQRGPTTFPLLASLWSTSKTWESK